MIKKTAAKSKLPIMLPEWVDAVWKNPDELFVCFIC